MASPVLRGFFAGRNMQGAVRCWPQSASVRRSLALKPLGHGVLGILPRRALATAAMSAEQLSGFRVNQDRLMKDLHRGCQWGQGTRWGEYVDSLLRM